MTRIEFGADGIRGEVGKWPFQPHTMFRIGQALGQFVLRQSKNPFVVIGRDTRTSGSNLLHCLAAGCTGQGVDVIDLDVMTTPGVAFLARRLEAGLGVAVSASHNPLECNGIKLVKSNGLRLQREEEIEIESLIDEFTVTAYGDAYVPGRQMDGANLVELYVEDHVKHCSATSSAGLKIVLDCADGAVSRVASAVFERLGVDVVVINAAMEGKSINYRCGSEYVREHPQEILDVMQQNESMYGFAFDGDGDRLVVVDADGYVYDGNDLLFVLATHFQARHLLRGNTIVTIDQANRGLEDALYDRGIQTLYTKNGDKHLEAAMWAGDYLLGGEPGGNIIINDGHHTAADAVYLAVVLVEILVCNPGSSLRAMVRPLEKRPQLTVSFELPTMLDAEQWPVLDQQIQQKREELGKDSRILVWDSSTEPGKYRVMVEGSRESNWEEVSQMAGRVRQMLEQVTQEVA